MLNKKEIEVIQNKIKTAEGRLFALKKGEVSEQMKASNWIHNPDAPIKNKYLGEDFSTDIKILEDYIYLLKRRLTLNE
jgi:hypothetical protein